MTQPGFGRLLDLGQGDLLNLVDARGTTLRVTRGKLWITQEGDLRDIVLQAGDVWTIENRGLTLARAERDASVAVVGAGMFTATARQQHARWRDRFADWMQRVGEARFDRRWSPYF